MSSLAVFLERHFDYKNRLLNVILKIFYSYIYHIFIRIFKFVIYRRSIRVI